MILPVAYLLLLYVSQWWYIEFADHAKVVLHGFPLAYTGPLHDGAPGLELYLMEGIGDYLFYAVVMYAIYRLMKPYFTHIILPKMAYAVMWGIVSLHLLFYMFTLVVPGKLHIYGRIPYVVSHMLEKGFSFGWMEPETGE